MTLMRNIIKRYRGGPDFADIKKGQHISYRLENYQVSLFLPPCNPSKPTQAKTERYPVFEPGWFEKHHSFIGHRKYLSLHESSWYFWPLIPMPLHGELGVLRLNLVIEKLPDNAPLSMTPAEFGELLLKKYNDYYNAEPAGDYGLGHNTEIKNTVEKKSAGRVTPWSEIEKKERIESIIKKRGFPVITEYQVIDILDNSWIHYREGNSKDQYIFSLLLNNGFYLTAKFSLDINMSFQDKPWYQDAVKAIPQMMKMIIVEYFFDKSTSEKFPQEIS